MADIVMEGGGVKGTALIGALSVFEAQGYNYMNLAGTSAGAIVAALTAAGYTAEELRKVMTDLDYMQFLDSGPRWLPRRTRGIYGLLCHWGIHRGDSFLAWMREMLAAKGVKTFADLKRGIPDKGQVYRLRVVASDVTRGRMLVLPNGIEHYGIRPERLEVALAVRMSMSIPGFYRPVTLRNNDGDTSYIVDGGLLSNFPIQLFDHPCAMEERPTFGLRLTSESKEKVTQHRAHNLPSYALSMFLTATEASYYQYIASRDFIRTVDINTKEISSVDFGLTMANKQMLYEEGVIAARAFLEDWDFDAWKRNYRRWLDSQRPTVGPKIVMGAGPMTRTVLGRERRMAIWKQIRDEDNLQRP
jgi:NTE family protein